MRTRVKNRVHVKVQIVELGDVVTFDQSGDQRPSFRDEPEELWNTWG
ncbi:hypothetical protein QG37_07406 [Candidozyma auris]|nr:hypothetical protein QG37_07406 [[Candida] auris]